MDLWSDDLQREIMERREMLGAVLSVLETAVRTLPSDELEIAVAKSASEWDDTLRDMVDLLTQHVGDRNALQDIMKQMLDVLGAACSWSVVATAALRRERENRVRKTVRETLQNDRERAP
jgi:hypothetical protein